MITIPPLKIWIAFHDSSPHNPPLGLTHPLFLQNCGGVMLSLPIKWNRKETTLALSIFLIPFVFFFPWNNSNPSLQTKTRTFSMELILQEIISTNPPPLTFFL